MGVARSVCRDWYGELAQGQIDALEELLRRAKESPRDKGGSPDHVWRIHLIRELADLYFVLKRPDPTTTKTSKDAKTTRGLFVDFVDGVFSAIGWPSAGIETAICKHLPPFRDFYYARREKLQDDASAEMAAAEEDQREDDGFDE
jgi:hypothetical protein